MKKLVLILALCLAAPAVWAQQKWTLQACLDYAMQNNITLQKAKLAQQSAAEELKGQKAALLPSLSASTNHSVGYRPWQDNGVTTVTNGQVNAKVDKTYYNGSYGLNAAWTVWNGNRNFHLLLQCLLNKSIQRHTLLTGKHSHLTVDGRSQPDIQHPSIALVGLYALFIAIGQIIINSLMESIATSLLPQSNKPSSLKQQALFLYSPSTPPFHALSYPNIN